MIAFPKIEFTPDQALGLEQFRAMDYFAVENFHLPIELMMENAGLNLAMLVATFVKPGSIIKIGVGNGNNGGGGLVAARRLSAWGFHIYLDVFTELTKRLPKVQMERALRFGARQEPIENPDVWIDAYLGFSQKLPLVPALNQRIAEANNSPAIKISLDLPTGFLGEINPSTFMASKVLTLAAPKKILLNLPVETEIYLADLGIPAEVYQKFGINLPPFHKKSIIHLRRAQ